MKHTKGKWTASVGDKGATINIDNDANHPLTFEMDFPDKYHHPELNAEAKANANLIASAPEMLDALRMVAIRIADLIYKMDGETVKKDGLTGIRGKNGEDELNEIYRLIAKAEGGA